MKGYQLTFFTQQNRHHRGKHVCDWLIDWGQARRLIGELILEIAPIGRTPHIWLETGLNLPSF